MEDGGKQLPKVKFIGSQRMLRVEVISSHPAVLLHAFGPASTLTMRSIERDFE